MHGRHKKQKNVSTCPSLPYLFILHRESRVHFTILYTTVTPSIPSWYITCMVHITIYKLYIHYLILKIKSEVPFLEGCLVCWPRWPWFCCWRQQQALMDPAPSPQSWSRPQSFSVQKKKSDMRSYQIWHQRWYWSSLISPGRCLSHLTGPSEHSQGLVRVHKWAINCRSIY